MFDLGLDHMSFFSLGRYVNEFIQIISFFEKAHLNSGARLLCYFLHYLCEISSDSGIHIYLSDLNKNMSGLTDLAKKRHGSADFHTPIHSPPLYCKIRDNLLLCSPCTLKLLYNRFYQSNLYKPKHSISERKFLLLIQDIESWRRCFRVPPAFWAIDILLFTLRWLKAVSSTFQDVHFDVTLLPLVITWWYNHGIKKLPNHQWTGWHHFRDTIGYHGNTMTC